jgi:hypothetical protein
VLDEAGIRFPFCSDLNLSFREAQLRISARDPTRRFERGRRNARNRRSAGILARRREGLKCAVSRRSLPTPVWTFSSGYPLWENLRRPATPRPPRDVDRILPEPPRGGPRVLPYPLAQPSLPARRVAAGSREGAEPTAAYLQPPRAVRAARLAVGATATPAQARLRAGVRRWPSSTAGNAAE